MTRQSFNRRSPARRRIRRLLGASLGRAIDRPRFAEGRQPGRHDLSRHLGGRLPRPSSLPAPEEVQDDIDLETGSRCSPWTRSAKFAKASPRRAAVRRASCSIPARARSSASKRGIFEKFDAARSSPTLPSSSRPRFDRRLRRRHVGAQVVGIAYNPKKAAGAQAGWKPTCSSRSVGVASRPYRLPARPSGHRSA